MFCPKCAVKNMEGAKFCRACGADISLVPRALMGRLNDSQSMMQDDEGQRSRSQWHTQKKEKRLPTIEGAMKNIFIGIAFLLIFSLGFVFFKGGFMIWIWMIIPGLACIGEGVGQFVRINQERKRLEALSMSVAARPINPPATPFADLISPGETSEIITAPTSITEETTRHLHTPVKLPNENT